MCEKTRIKSRGKGRLKLTAPVKLLDFGNMNFSIREVTEEKGERGRPPRSPEAMLKAFVVMVFKGFSERELETLLRSYPFWGRLCGFKGKPPCHATFSNFKKRIGEEELNRIPFDELAFLLYDERNSLIRFRNVLLDSIDRVKKSANKKEEKSALIDLW